jgi:hypothetical protein
MLLSFPGPMSGKQFQKKIKVVKIKQYNGRYFAPLVERLLEHAGTNKPPNSTVCA